MTFRIPLIRRTPARRTVTALVLAGAAFTGLTACTLWAPQDTLYIEEASVGPSATVGDVFVGNAVLVSGGGDTANLVVTLVNEGGDTQQVQLAPQGSRTISVTLEPREIKKLGDPPDELSTVTGLTAKPGALTTVTVTSAGNTVGLQVPVVTPALQPYSTLTPSPSS
ncbi:hypothetical protein [Leifsonia sp. C5G2]|uniref:hypothetical protein n=1 Tax=Leifsonia sp. C5G2 TaxID=2735269 RepID=UPI00158539AF|nr:hypothetical protein [Leifsonia sp. C5G2]NUU07704.1 hypothetical protein [Leifsonia sp. C5G2]